MRILPGGLPPRVEAVYRLNRGHYAAHVSHESWGWFGLGRRRRVVRYLGSGTVYHAVEPSFGRATSETERAISGIVGAMAENGRYSWEAPLD